MVLSSFVVQVFCLFFLIIENTLPQVVRIEGYASVAECDTRETLITEMSTGGKVWFLSCVHTK